LVTIEDSECPELQVLNASFHESQSVDGSDILRISSKAFLKMVYKVAGLPNIIIVSAEEREVAL
jgi:hypothetical protein